MRATLVVLVLALVIGVLLWIAATHYAHGVDALKVHSYSRAVSEFSLARVLVFPYRDARSLEEQARRALMAGDARREQAEARRAAVVAQLETAGARIAAGDADGVLTTLQAIDADDLQVTLAGSATARASAAALAVELAADSRKALRNAAWGRAGRFATALLVLEPSSELAVALGARARTGADLGAKLGEARDAARRGKWRAALRGALAVLAVQKDFPGAAAVVADARVALAPKPKPKPAATQAATIVTPPPTTGSATTTAPPPPPTATATAAAMTLRSTARGRGRTSRLTALAVSLALLCVGVASADAATPPWSPVAPPWDAAWAINDVYAFGATGLAAAGDGGHIGVSRDGGHSWSVVVPAGLEATAFTAIALGTSGRGVVASGSFLLVTSDGGSTWRTPSYIGPGAGAAINDVALRGSLAVAVGDGGVIMSSGDAGATWRKLASPTLDPITSVAIAGGGTAVAGSAAGEILVGAADVWALAGAVAGPVTSVAASTDPVWGDGRPDLFAATGSDVLGSDDALTFASLPGLPDLSSQPWPSLAWAGVPERSLLIAGAQNAGFFEPLSGLWLPGPTGLGDSARAVAPGDQSVAYVLASDGRLVRTLSAGREPATLQLSRTFILVGASTRLTATVRVGAPGVVLLRHRVPGRPWETARTASWTSGDWNRRLSFLLKPSLTHEYRLELNYGGATVELAAAAQVVVTPKIDTLRSGFALRVGDVYRFSGSVTPKLPGARVGVFTDRGGSWRPVSKQGSVKLRDGRTWTSRRFGTPKAETYRLRAHLAGTSAHAEAWSRIVTVKIR